MRQGMILAGVCALAVTLGASGPVLAHEENEERDGYAWSGGPPEGDDLRAFGEWVRVPTHGRVWRPRVEAEWRPYWRGHWAWEGQWVWVSADPWGDGPSHYGEWLWSPRYGWVWIPGTEWSPARVTWIVSGPIIAWAPASIHVSIGSEPRFWAYADADTFQGRVVRPYRIPPPHQHLRAARVTEEIGRVFVPEPRPPRRTVRPAPPRDRSIEVNTERRVSTRRPNHVVRSQSPDAPRVRGRGGDVSRGFERRDAR